MNYKWIGALFIVAGCSSVGISIASVYRRNVKAMQQFLRAIAYMECDLQYRLTPLPELCRQTGKEAEGVLRTVFFNLARELDWQTAPDVCSCMSAALKKSPELPPLLRRHFIRLGQVLGRFDLPGQLKGLRAVKTACSNELSSLENDRDVRMRNYQTLGLCAGVAIVILFI